MTEESADNRRNFRKLVLAIEASYGKLSLLMALSDNWKHRNELIEKYETELTGKGTHCYRIKLDQQQYSLKQCLFDLARQEPELGNENAVVTVLGADELLGVRLRQDEKSSQEKLFFSLQWTREALRQFQVPVVLWLTPQIAGQLAQAAPDFWSWRGGVFEFSKPIAWTLADRPVAKTLSGLEDKPDSTKANPADIAKQIAELEAQDPESPLLTSLYMDLGAAYRTAVRYEDAVGAYKQAVKLGEARLGAEHVDVAMSLGKLACSYELMGNYSKAESLYQRSLEINELQLGVYHLDTAASLNNLALLYKRIGRYGEAESLYLRSLEIYESELGANHPDTAMSLNNLALLYESMGRYSEAEPLYLRSLRIKESQLGIDHPLTATSLNNLALLYESMGRYGEAETLYVRSLEIIESQLGADHPEMARSLNNLAALYYYMGRYSEAEPLYLRSLKIRELHLGADHSDTAESLNNLAALYESIGRYGEAEPLFLRAIQIDEKAFPSDHPYIEKDKNNFRRLLEKAIATGKTDQLSNHPLTQALLKELQIGQESSS
ncbi:tetratricopeptide repeat protein [Leptolyngbya ectocarpi]|nr:tetratricopeptide repeat protein [Leptolyngbya ectocarpi]